MKTYSKWIRDHTTHWRGRRPKQFSRVWKKGVPGHYAPRMLFSTRDAQWINRFKRIRRVFGQQPPCIGGGYPCLFLSRRYGRMLYREIDDRGGFKGWWTTVRPPRPVIRR